jgi:rod shape determining protein RodA
MKKLEAYNLNESEKAISSGGFTGKGYLEGTRTTGNFVPEQHTDYIFSTVGEEWGFLGICAVVIVFVLLMLRVLILAERQKKYL